MARWVVRQVSTPQTVRTYHRIFVTARGRAIRRAAPGVPTTGDEQRRGIVKHTREETRETATGRIVTRTVTTWDVVREGGELVSEHRTRRDAERAIRELSFRLNDGNVLYPTMTRLDSLTNGMTMKRLTYAALIN